MNVPSKNDFRLLIGAKLTNLKIFLKLRKYWLFSNHLFCLVTLRCTNIIHSCQNMVGGKIQICWKNCEPSFVRKIYLWTHSNGKTSWKGSGWRDQELMKEKKKKADPLERATLLRRPLLDIFRSFFYKVHIFWEGHKILRNLHLTFVLWSASQK